MSEAEFNEKVLEWAEKAVRSAPERHKRLARCKLDRIEVKSTTVLAATMPWCENSHDTAWVMKPFRRQIDVVVGLAVELDGKPDLLPIVVVELKAGPNLNTDELDKKSAIYGPLRERYPWVFTVFLHEDYSERGGREEYLLRNGRQFDAIFTEWNKKTQEMLRDIIDQRLLYMLWYWEF